MSRIALGFGLILGAFAFAIYPDPAPAAKDLACTMQFGLSTWVAPGKPSEGSGVVDCGGGATLRVRIVARGARLHDATSHVDGASGIFTGIRSVGEIPGAYTDADAGRATDDAQILSKGRATLALTGGNAHLDLGTGLGEVVLTRSR